MTEYVNTYNIKSPYFVMPMIREEFYDEQIAIYEKGGEPTKAVEITNVFLFNEWGELMVQKRSSNKRHNPNLLDKSMGGHVTNGDSPNYTVMVETVQELQVPSVVLDNNRDFMKTFKTMKGYLSSIGIIKSLDHKIFNMEKIFDGKKVIIANLSNIYVGAYSGRAKTVDREAKGILSYTLDDLKQEIKDAPNTFTHDLRFYFEKYEKELREFSEFIAQELKQS